jgi:hypothetical protein
MLKFRSRQSPTIAEVAEKHAGELMRIRGVEAVGVGRDNGQAVIKVYVSRLAEKLRPPLPDELEGYQVKPVITGSFYAL